MFLRGRVCNQLIYCTNDGKTLYLPVNKTLSSFTPIHFLPCSIDWQPRASAARCLRGGIRHVVLAFSKTLVSSGRPYFLDSSAEMGCIVRPPAIWIHQLSSSARQANILSPANSSTKNVTAEPNQGVPGCKGNQHKCCCFTLPSHNGMGAQIAWHATWIPQ